MIKNPPKNTPAASRVVAKPSGKSVPQPVHPANVKPAKREAGTPALDAAKKPGKQKKTNASPTVVRDSFTIPGDDYAMIAGLKNKCLEAGVNAKKSEIVRAGLHALNALDVAQLTKIVSAVEKVKTGRPAKPADSKKSGKKKK